MLSVENAALFYEMCIQLNLNTEEDRAALMHQMALEGLIDTVYDTKRTRDQIVADFKKRYNVLDLGGKDEE